MILEELIQKIAEKVEDKPSSKEIEVVELKEKILNEDSATKASILNVNTEVGNNKQANEDLARGDLETVSDEDSEDLEAEISDENSESDQIQVQYGFSEEEFLHNLYQGPAVDYEKMWYGSLNETPPKFASEAYQASEVSSSDSLNNVEAVEVMESIQYAAIFGTEDEVNLKERQKFDTWIKFNPGLFKLYERTVAFTDDVNYSV